MFPFDDVIICIDLPLASSNIFISDTFYTRYRHILRTILSHVTPIYISPVKGRWHYFITTDFSFFFKLTLIYMKKGGVIPIIIRINTLRPRQNGRRFPDDIFKCIFLDENVWIPIKISLNIVPTGPMNNIPALVQIMAWRRPGDKPLSGPMMVSLLTHICVARPQWVKYLTSNFCLETYG